MNEHDFKDHIKLVCAVTDTLEFRNKNQISYHNANKRLKKKMFFSAIAMKIKNVW